jgi:hypothetical protein
MYRKGPLFLAITAQCDILVLSTEDVMDKVLTNIKVRGRNVLAIISPCGQRLYWNAKMKRWEDLDNRK